MEKKETQANDGGVQETDEWWGRARHRQMMRKSRRDTQLTGEANDGEEGERQANDGRVQEAGE